MCAAWNAHAYRACRDNLAASGRPSLTLVYIINIMLPLTSANEVAHLHSGTEKHIALKLRLIRDDSSHLIQRGVESNKVEKL